jgi:hypothetical protein
MDEQYLQALRQNILLTLRRAEASLYNGAEVDLDSVIAHVEIFQAYLNKHLPQNPTEDLKMVIQDTFHDLQVLSDRIAKEIKLAKIKISEGKSAQKITNAYTYGVRK